MYNHIIRIIITIIILIIIITIISRMILDLSSLIDACQTISFGREALVHPWLRIANRRMLLYPIAELPIGACAGSGTSDSEKGDVLLRGVGTLRYLVSPNASVQWQPAGLTIHTKKWFLGAAILGAPPTSLTDGSGASGGHCCYYCYCYYCNSHYYYYYYYHYYYYYYDYNYY